jgi:hypothetical protein
MKTILFSFIIMALPFWGASQTYNYTSDANGNRVARAHVQLKKGSSIASEKSLLSLLQKG